jgi:hypothetical protein
VFRRRSLVAVEGHICRRDKWWTLSVRSHPDLILQIPPKSSFPFPPRSVINSPNKNTTNFRSQLFLVVASVTTSPMRCIRARHGHGDATPCRRARHVRFALTGQRHGTGGSASAPRPRLVGALERHRDRRWLLREVRRWGQRISRWGSREPDSELSWPQL